MNRYLLPTIISYCPCSCEGPGAKDGGNRIDVRYRDWSIARMSDIDGIAHVLLLFVEASTRNCDIPMIAHCRWPGVTEIDSLDLRGAVACLIRCGPFSLKAATTSRNIFVC